MSTQEFWWEYDTKAKLAKSMPSPRTSGSKFTEAEWDAARKKFREMKDGRAANGSSR